MVIYRWHGSNRSQEESETNGTLSMYQSENWKGRGRAIIKPTGTTTHLSHVEQCPNFCHRQMKLEGDRTVESKLNAQLAM